MYSKYDPDTNLYDDDDDVELLLLYVWPTKDVCTYLQPESLSAILTIANFHHIASVYRHVLSVYRITVFPNQIKKLCQISKIGRRDNNKMFWKIVTSEKLFSYDYKKGISLIHFERFFDNYKGKNCFTSLLNVWKFWEFFRGFIYETLKLLCNTI